MRPRDAYTRARLGTLHPISLPTATPQIKSAFISVLRSSSPSSRKGKSNADHPRVSSAPASQLFAGKLPDFRAMAVRINSQVDRFGMSYTLPLFLGQHYGVLQRFYAAKAQIGRAHV